MDSKELNEKIKKICEGEKLDIKGLEGTGKNIPYIGWFWRYIDFDKPIPIGKKLITGEEAKNIKNMLEDIVNDATVKKLQEFFDYMQTLM